MRVFVDSDCRRHTYVARLGPLGNLLLALMIGILFAIMLVLALGAFLIAIPLIGLLVAAVIIFGIITRIFSPPAPPARPIDSASRPRRLPCEPRPRRSCSAVRNHIEDGDVSLECERAPFGSLRFSLWISDQLIVDFGMGAIGLAFRFRLCSVCKDKHLRRFVRITSSDNSTLK